MVMQARSKVIVHRQEALAVRLLDLCLPEDAKKEPPIDVQLDVFEKVGKWVAIKNRLTDLEETDIDRFKARIHGTEAAPLKGRRAHRPLDSAERLAAIKARLPDRGNGSDERDSDDSGE